MTLKTELSRIVGPQNVFDDEQTLAAYSKDESFVLPRAPQCVAKPSSTEGVQQIIIWANEKSEPIVPVSSPGGPRFRGDTIPAQGGVVVDLSNMNKILHVDRRDKVVMIEPGVTFPQLDSVLKRSGLKSIKPLLPRSNKSALTSYLEREPSITPHCHWDATDPLICVEVVFGTGDVFKTGSAAGPGTIAEQYEAGVRQVNPAGPGLTSLSRVIQGAQGTLGIVTWATAVCRLQPEHQKPFFIGAQRLNELAEMAYGLLRRRIGEELFIINNVLLAALINRCHENPDALSGPLPPWIMLLNLTGYKFYPEERIAYQEDDAHALAESLGLDLVHSLGGLNATVLMHLIDNHSCDYLPSYKGNVQSVPFLATLDKMPEILAKANTVMASSGYSPADLGVYLQPVVQGCACHGELYFIYDSQASRERMNVAQAIQKACESMADAGAFFSRPYGPLAAIAYGKDAAAAAALRKVKNIFDPNHIMNPGKLCYEEVR